MSRKAQEGMSLNAIIGLILAFISVAILTYIIFVFIGVFTKSQQDLDSTLNNYEELNLKVEEMIENRDDRFTIERFPLYISDGYSIIGFDRFQNYIIDMANNKIYKPSKCRNKGCICLYVNPPFYGGVTNFDDITRKDEGVVDCKRYNQHIVFGSKYRIFEKGHPDTTGMERGGFPGFSYPMEYFVAHGYMSFRPFPGQMLFNRINLFKTDWNIQNVELIKQEYNDQIYFEISAIPDEETLRKEQIRETAFNMMQSFLPRFLPQSIPELTQHDIEGELAAEILEENEELYLGKNYQGFLSALYESDLAFGEKRSVFISVSYSMFHNDVLALGIDDIASMLYVDYPAFETVQIGDYEVNLGIQTFYDPSGLLVETQFELQKSDTEAKLIFFISDIP
jgi:hypothetical protein